MGQRCGCVGTECTCRIGAGRGVGLSGTGSQTNPLVVTQHASAYLRAGSTDETLVTLGGSGVVEDPYTLGMDFTGVPDSKPLSIQTFTLPGSYTWTFPVGTALIEVTCIGAGAGGTAGGSAPASSWGYGAPGGQGGGWSKKIVAVGAATSCSISVGYGGSPGTSAGEVGGWGFDSYLIVGTNVVIAKGGGPGTSTGGGVGFHTGVHGPITGTDPRIAINTPAAGGGGKGANGNEDLAGSISGGAHTWYDGWSSQATTLGYGGDGGRGGRSFSSGAQVAPGNAVAGTYPGGGGGGGRGGANSLDFSGFTWTFPPSAGGAGAHGFVRVVAY